MYICSSVNQSHSRSMCSVLLSTDPADPANAADPANPHKSRDVPWYSIHYKICSRVKGWTIGLANAAGTRHCNRSGAKGE